MSIFKNLNNLFSHSGKKGLSGGEKKRLSFASALLRDFCCDIGKKLDRFTNKKNFDEVLLRSLFENVSTLCIIMAALVL